jgi:hypothetical protein
MVQKTTATTISVESLDEWDCNVLTPRSDGVSLSTSTSETVEFSIARLNLADCKSTLEEAAVCSTARVDSMLRYTHVEATQDNCESTYLPYNYRICQGKDSSTNINSTYYSSFGTHASSSDYTVLDSTYGNMILMNSTTLTILSGMSVSDYNTYKASDIIAVGDNKVAYVTYSETANQPDSFFLNVCAFLNSTLDTANTSATYSYEAASTLNSCLKFPMSEIGSVSGLAADLAGERISVLSIDSSSYVASLYTYYVATGEEVEVKSAFNCSDYFYLSSSPDSTTTTSSDYDRYISYGDDGYLYIICTDDTSVTAASTGKSSDARRYVCHYILQMPMMQVAAAAARPTQIILCSNLMWAYPSFCKYITWI